jgi:PTS system galactitol-specific IIA component
MLKGFFYAMTGEWGLAVIDFATNNPGFIIVFFGLWLSTFYLGRYQLNSIRRKTEAWALESSQRILALTPGITVDHLYEQLYPEWVVNLRGTAYFIPHRWEIWPVPATPRFVKGRIDFTPEWLGGFLWANGIKLPGSKAPEEKESSNYLPYDQDCVHDTFIEAVIAREKIFATGLPTPEIQVAIPHADVEHVKRSAIAVGLLRSPVPFGEMGNPDGTVQVQLVCCLAVKESESLVSLLQDLVGIFQDTAFLRQLLKQENAEVVANLINGRLPVYQEE